MTLMNITITAIIFYSLTDLFELLAAHDGFTSLAWVVNGARPSSRQGRPPHTGVPEIGSHPCRLLGLPIGVGLRLSGMQNSRPVVAGDTVSIASCMESAGTPGWVRTI